MAELCFAIFCVVAIVQGGSKCTIKLNVAEAMCSLLSHAAFGAFFRA